MSLSLNDIKRDMEELISIINEEHVSRAIVMKMSDCCEYNMDKNTRLNEIKRFVQSESEIAYITNLERHKISDRFVDKIVDVASRYGIEELKMLFQCTYLVLNDEAKKDRKQKI